MKQRRLKYINPQKLNNMTQESKIKYSDKIINVKRESRFFYKFTRKLKSELESCILKRVNLKHRSSLVHLSKNKIFIDRESKFLGITQ